MVSRGTDPVGQRLDRLTELIAEAPLNLVSARDRALVRTRHVDEAWRLGDVLACEPDQRWLDLGTGGGLPGLVLALRFPQTEFTLLDATRKKMEAVARFIDVLEMENVTPLWERAEVLARRDGERETYDGVISRAVGSLDVVMELSRAFVRRGGRIVAVKGPAAEQEVEDLLPWLRPLRLTTVDLRRLDLDHRSVFVVSSTATAHAPSWVPREVGVPQRQPLSAERLRRDESGRFTWNRRPT